MEKTNAATPTEGSPFFDLLADADEIKIREVRPETKENTEDELSALGSTDQSRTFLVRIKAKPTPPPKLSTRTEDKTVDPENRIYLLKSAELLLVDADFVLARNIYSYLLKVNIRDCEAMRGLGICFYRLSDHISAKKCFKALLELDGKEENLLWLGQCYIAEGNDVAALEHFNKVAAPGNLPKTTQFELFKEMGNCETRAGNFDQAWSYYHRALEIQPTSDTIHVNLGTLEMQRQHVDVALSYFKMALTLNAASSRARCGQGLVAVAKNDLPLAKAEFEASLDLDSQNIVALFQLAAMSATGDSETGKTRLRAFLERDLRNSEVRYALAVLLFREARWAECTQEVETLLSFDPQHPRAKSLKEQLNSNKHRPE